jgi:hypothetical protein
MLADYLNQTVTYEQFHSRDMANDVSYNAAVSLPARVSYRQKKVYTQTGDEVISICHVTVAREVSYDDRFTLPDGKILVPKALRHARNADGTLHHTGVDL